MTAVARFYEALDMGLIPVAVPIEDELHQTIGLAAQGMSYDDEAMKLLYAHEPERRAYGALLAIRETQLVVQQRFDSFNNQGFKR